MRILSFRRWTFLFYIKYFGDTRQVPVNRFRIFGYFADDRSAPSLSRRLTIEYVYISQKTGRKCFLAFLFIKSSVSSHIAAIVKGMLPGNNHRGLNPLAHISASLMAITYRHSRCFLTACLSPSHTSNECQFFDKTIFSWQYVDKNLGN